MYVYVFIYVIITRELKHNESKTNQKTEVKKI